MREVMTPWPLGPCIFRLIVPHAFSKGSNVFFHLVDLFVAVPSILDGVSDEGTRVNILTWHALALRMGGLIRFLTCPLSFRRVLLPCAIWIASLKYSSWWHVGYAKYGSPWISCWKAGTLKWRETTSDVQAREFAKGSRWLLLSMKAPNVMVEKRLVLLIQVFLSGGSRSDP